jgi:ubiquinone/menaquinone biosynthesis C-methylase UbiE
VDETPTSPDRRTVLTGKAISALVAHAPWSWPLLNRPVMNFFDRAASGWDERTGAGSVDHLAPLSAGVLDVAIEPERILDIGCGTGAATLFLAREFPRARIRGVDISPMMISRATAKIGLDPEARVAFREADASKLPWPDRSFDLVTLVNMPLFFGEINRVLRPGGSVIVVATLGDDTPFSTPTRTIKHKFKRLGLDRSGGGSAGRGTWFTARKANDHR